MNRSLLCGVLIMAVVLSALSVIYVKHQTRRHFVLLQEMQQARDTMQIEWGQLQLEEGALSSVDQLLSTAERELQLVKPTLEQTVFVSP